jgi:LmbE family N-acetylglucosaminyl deacetylase
MNLVCVGAHPDDCEFSVGGTAAKCRKRGDNVTLVTVTNGDRGHFFPEYVARPHLLASRRLEEARKAAAAIGAESRTLNLHDGGVYVNEENTMAIVRLLRELKPDLVLFNRNVDYHRDHRYASQLVLDATFMLTVPLYCPETPALKRMPVFAYWFDRFTEGQPFRADVPVPIDSVIREKADVGQEHVSQFYEWLPWHAGRYEEVPQDAEGRRRMMEEMVRNRGEWVRENLPDELLRKWAPNRDVQCCEAFQICEYGELPGEDALVQLFPVAD